MWIGFKMGSGCYDIDGKCTVCGEFHPCACEIETIEYREILRISLIENFKEIFYISNGKKNITKTGKAWKSNLFLFLLILKTKHFYIYLSSQTITDYKRL